MVTLMGFVPFYGILPSITAFIGCFSLLDGPNNSFDPFSTVLRKALSPLFFIFL
jgi:hypothetical protein